MPTSQAENILECGAVAAFEVLAKLPTDYSPTGSTPSISTPAIHWMLTGLSNYKFTLRSRNALPITDTELRLIAALAIIGESSQPKNGYKTPAATGMPSVL